LTAGCGTFGRPTIGGKGGNVERGKRNFGAADIGSAGRAADQAGSADQLAAMAANGLHAFARGKTGRNNVFNDEDAGTFGDLKTPLQHEATVLSFDKNGLGAQLARRLVARHDSAHRR
jgi:hypothetical protein